MSSGSWQTALVLFLGLILANGPFVLPRFALFGPKKAQRPIWLLLDLLLAYAIFLGVGWALENQMGQRHGQAWQFYAISASLFLSMGFPGFVWRYLLRRPG